MAESNGSPKVTYSFKELMAQFTAAQSHLDERLDGVPLKKLQGLPDRVLMLETENRGLKRALWMIVTFGGMVTGSRELVPLILKALVP